jgi:hypothetical protein
MNASLITLRQLSIIMLVAVLALLAMTPASQAQFVTGNLLVDPSFENPVLTPFPQIIGPPFTTGVWGGENAANVLGPVNGVIPLAGARMHRQDNAGGVATQSWQLVDVSPFTAAINAGNASFLTSALYNVSQGIPAGVASISVSPLNAGHAPTGAAISVGSILDASPATWQPINASAPVPVNTQFLRLQVAYSNASLMSSSGAFLPGFVDDARLVLRVVPEPATMGLGALALAGVALMARRRT